MDRRWDKSKPPQGPFTLNRDCPQARGLVAWYPMGGVSGRTAVFDLVGKAHLSGTTRGGTLGEDGRPALTYSSGSSDSLASSVLALTAYPCTIAGWYRQTSAAAAAIACMSSTDGASGHGRKLLYAGSNFTVRAFDENAGAGSQAVTTAAGALNRWAHGAAVFTSSMSRTAYSSGANAAQDTTGTGTWANGLDTRLGSDLAGNLCTGDIGEVGFWNVALDDGTVFRLYDPSTRFELWYPLRSRKWFTQGGVSAGPVGLGSEIDTSFSPGGLARGNPGLASETNASLSPGGAASGAVALSSEVDTALVLTGIMRGPVGAAVEVDTALGLGSGGQDIGTSAESDTAFGLSGIMFGPIGLAQESDAAVSPGGDAQPSVAGGGGDSMLPRRKRRYVVNDGERLLVFDSQRDAVAAQARIDEARSAASRAIEHAKRPAAKARISRRAADVALSAFPPIVPIETVGPVELAAAMDFDASGALRALVHQQAEAAAVYEALEQARDEDDIAALLEYA